MSLSLFYTAGGTLKEAERMHANIAPGGESDLNKYFEKLPTEVRLPHAFGIMTLLNLLTPRDVSVWRATIANVHACLRSTHAWHATIDAHVRPHIEGRTAMDVHSFIKYTYDTAKELASLSAWCMSNDKKLAGAILHCVDMYLCHVHRLMDKHKHNVLRLSPDHPDHTSSRTYVRESMNILWSTLVDKL
jgi:hypothetical protein